MFLNYRGEEKLFKHFVLTVTVRGNLFQVIPYFFFFTPFFFFVQNFISEFPEADVFSHFKAVACPFREVPGTVSRALHPTDMDYFICLMALNLSYTDKSTMHSFFSEYFNLAEAQ